MSIELYQQAQRLGLKEVKALEAKGENPYVPALEQSVPGINGLTTVPLGVLHLPIEQVAGTKTASRSDAFSRSFYPLMDSHSEFGVKWSHLVDSCEAEGIRDPIKAVEYMHRYYVIEGNKRVSVLRFTNAAYVAADVSRIIPARTDEPENRAYFEFLDFYSITGLGQVVLRRPGQYGQLLKLLGKERREDWDEGTRKKFAANCAWFRSAYQKLGEQRLEPDEAMLRYLQIYGYAYLQSRSPQELKQDLENIGGELLRGEGEDPALMLEPGAEQAAPKTGLFGLRRRRGFEGVLKVAMLHDKDCETSPWTEAHELGRAYVQTLFDDRIETASFFHALDEPAEARIEGLVKDGYHMVFTTTPRLLGAALTAAAKYPQVKFLNCSLNIGSPLVRTYYGRMHEAKLLTGVIAGALSPNGKIGCVCSYPVYGMPAAVNAFALGARMVDPEAQIYLEWSAEEGADIPARFRDRQVTVVSGEDLYAPSGPEPESGLYLVRDGEARSAAQAVCVWGRFYERIIRSVLDGGWSDTDRSAAGGSALNYWWGVSSGMIDLIYKYGVPAGTRRLIDLLRREIAAGAFDPFEGPVYDNAGNLRIRPGERPAPMDVVRMDWLAEGVVGELPPVERLCAEARELVKLQGVGQLK